MGQSVSTEPGRGRTAVHRPVVSFGRVARQVRIKDEDGRHSVVPSGPVFSGTFPTHPSKGPTPTVLSIPHRLQLFTVFYRCFQLFSTVPCHPLPSCTRTCLRSWGLLFFLMTAVRKIQGQGRTTFCRHVSSRALGSSPAGPYRGPGQLRTLALPH